MFKNSEWEKVYESEKVLEYSNILTDTRGYGENLKVYVGVDKETEKVSVGIVTFKDKYILGVIKDKSVIEEVKDYIVDNAILQVQRGRGYWNTI